MIHDDHSESQKNNIVDETYHKVNSKQFFDYESSLKGFKPFENVPSDKGVSTKAISKIGNDKYMTRAYHARADQEIRQLPIAGWGIMATKRLYNSAGLDNLIEDVGMSNVNYNKKDIPVTVHKFSKEHPNQAVDFKQSDLPVDLGSTLSPNTPTSTPKITNNHGADKLQSRQIGLMDYLTGNYDRNSGNLLLSDKNQSGKRNMLAIDHDRSFYYYMDHSSAPHDHYINSSITRTLNDNASQEHDPENDSKLHKWWNENKNNIQTEMNDSVNSIKDEKMRKYVRNNFDQRYGIINDWSDEYPTNKKSLFQRDDKTEKSKPYEPYAPDSDTVKRILDSLPDDRHTAMNVLTSILENESNDNSKIYTTKAIARHVALDTMTSDEFVKFIGKTETNHDMIDLKNDLVERVLRHSDRHMDKARKLIEMNNSLPKDSKILSPWQEHGLKEKTLTTGSASDQTQPVQRPA